MAGDRPLVYRERNGQDRIGFTKNSAGQMLLSRDFPAEVLTRVSFRNSKDFNLFLIVLVVVVSVLTLALWPLATWI